MTIPDKPPVMDEDLHRRSQPWFIRHAVPVCSIGLVLVLVLACGWFWFQTSRPAQDTPLTELDGSDMPALIQPQNLTLAPETLKPLTADEARLANAEVPLSLLPISPARPFFAPNQGLEDYSRALDCMTAAIYYEAAWEPVEGQRAVAQVIINRMRHPAYPGTVCGVVFEGAERSGGCQFSFTCYGAMSRPPAIAGWARARAVANAALNGSVAREVGLSTHYHADYVLPYWAASLVKVRVIGAHIFYRWPGGWGLPASFRKPYGLAEPVIQKMAALSSLSAVEEGSAPLEAPPLPDIATTVILPEPSLTPVPRLDIPPPVPLTPVPATATPPERAEARPSPVLADPLVPAGNRDTRQRGRRLALPTP